jgi:hypothetical protein
MLDPYSVEVIKKRINKNSDAVKEHICYGVDTIEKLNYSRGQLIAYDVMLQELKDLQKEDDDGDTNTT